MFIFQRVTIIDHDRMSTFPLIFIEMTWLIRFKWPSIILRMQTDGAELEILAPASNLKCLDIVAKSKKIDDI